MNSILLLDIDFTLHELLKRKLEHEGFKVTVGSSSDMPPSAFDLVISGETLKGNKLKQWFKSIPIIQLSHDSVPLDKDIWRLVLPFRPSDLLDLARQSLSSHT
jgi:hypothetical protein